MSRTNARKLLNMRVPRGNLPGGGGIVDERRCHLITTDHFPRPTLQ
jgi:hypothetical protein